MPHSVAAWTTIMNDYEWVERSDEGTKRILRVGFPGGNRITWMCRNADDEKWSRNMTPTVEQWDVVENKVRGRYNRRRAGFKDVELVMALRKNHA